MNNTNNKKESCIEFWVLLISSGMLSDLRKAPGHDPSHRVVQLSIHHGVHVINGVHSGGKVHQELPNVRQAVFLHHRLTFRQRLQEVRPVRRSQKCSLKQKENIVDSSNQSVQWPPISFSAQPVLAGCFFVSRTTLCKHWRLLCVKIPWAQQFLEYSNWYQQSRHGHDHWDHSVIQDVFDHQVTLTATL